MQVYINGVSFLLPTFYIFGRAAVYYKISVFSSDKMKSAAIVEDEL